MMSRTRTREFGVSDSVHNALASILRALDAVHNSKVPLSFTSKALPFAACALRLFAARKAFRGFGIRRALGHVHAVVQ